MRVLRKRNNHICVSFDTSFLYDPRLTDPEYKYHFSYKSCSAENYILPQGKHILIQKAVYYMTGPLCTIKFLATQSSRWF